MDAKNGDTVRAHGAQRLDGVAFTPLSRRDIVPRGAACRGLFCSQSAVSRRMGEPHKGGERCPRMQHVDVPMGGGELVGEAARAVG